MGTDRVTIGVCGNFGNEQDMTTRVTLDWRYTMVKTPFNFNAKILIIRETGKMKMVNTGGGHKNPNLRISPGMPRGPNNEYEKPQQHVLSLRRDLAQASHVPVWKEIWDFPRRHRDSLVLWGGHPPLS